MADTELLPCPFCGNDSVHVQDSYLHGQGFMVMCGNCTAEGPLCDIEQNAAAQWNRRAALASRPAEVDDEGLPKLPKPTCLVPGVYAYTWQQYRRGQRDAVAADRARREKPPANAAEMVAFIGNHYNSMRDDKPDPNDIVYELTVHDLLSAFRWWFDEFELEDEPSHTTIKEK